MKAWFRLAVIAIAALAALVVGALVAPTLSEDPGYVLIEFAGWRLQMSFLVLAGAVLAIWLLTSLIVALLRMPGRTVRRLRETRYRRALDRGLIALSEGDWSRAERSLALSMQGPHAQTAGLLAAARAAQGQADPDRRDFYLEQADSAFGRRHFATALVRARLLIGDDQVDAAIELLEQLHLKKPRHEGVLKLLLQAYQQRDRWREVRLLVPSLRRARILGAQRAEELIALAAARELESAEDVERLQALYQSLDRKHRVNREVLAAYARRALELDRPELVEAQVRKALESDLDAGLLGLYSEADSSDIGQRIQRCEKWLGREPDNPALHLALGRLYLAQREDEKAREHLQIAVQHSGDPAAYAALGQVLDRAGQIESAAQCYRNALRLEQGRAPEPLPRPVNTGAA